jgi:membrane-bound serine protease (ClpP class)
MLGELGIAITELNPMGKVRVRGEYWNATAPAGAPVEPGSKVRITAIDGLELIVQPEGSTKSGTGE